MNQQSLLYRIWEYMSAPAVEAKGRHDVVSLNEAVGIRGQGGRSRELSYKALVDDAYLGNPDGYAALNQIARALAGIELRVEKRKGDLWEPLNQPKHPLSRLLAHPCPNDSRVVFMTGVVVNLFLGGDSYMLVVPDATGMPWEMHLLRPDQVKVIAGDARMPVTRYDWTPREGAAPIPIRTEDIVHVRLFHPLKERTGHAAVASAAAGIDQGNEGRVCNAQLIRNRAAPDGVLTLEQELSEPAQHDLAQSLRNRYSGPSNAGHTLVVPQGGKWERASLTPRDMDWAQTMVRSTLDICRVLEVPPEVIGEPGTKTYANYREARRSLYTESVLPLLDLVMAALNDDLVPRFDGGDELQISYDRADIEALAEDQDHVWARVGAAWFLTLNEKRTLVGLEPLDGEWAEEIYLPSNLMPLGDAVAPEEPDGDGDDDDKDEEPGE